jgi:hypothetical protein
MKVTINVTAAQHELDTVRAAIAAQRDTSFWVECVRDASGRWAKYVDLSSRYGVKYFRGHQPRVRYDNPDEVRYLLAHVEVRQGLYNALQSVPQMDVEQFTKLLESLRRSLEYRPVDEWLHQRFSTPTHTIIVKESVMSIASHYGDPYAQWATRGPVFTGFPVESLPHDEVVGEQLIHHYPTLEHSNVYLSAALGALKRALQNASTPKEYIYAVADMYQYLINLHYFAAMNASLYMNMANGLLAVAGIRGVEHGIIDFVALRLQPENFQKYFYDCVIG